jgi:hypothetical protein
MGSDGGSAGAQDQGAANAGRSKREIYFVMTPATGDLRQIEAGKGSRRRRR